MAGHIVGWVVLALGAPAARAQPDCPEGTPPDELVPAAVALQQVMRPDDYERQRAALEVRLQDCLREPASRALVAALHQGEVVGQHLRGDAPELRAAVWAVRAHEPGWVLPEHFDEYHPIRLAWEAPEPVDPRTTLPIEPEPGFTAWVDGEAALLRPTQRPFVFQWLGAERVRTAYVHVGEPVPLPPRLAPLEPPAAPEVVAALPAEPQRQGRSPALAIASAVVAGAGAAAVTAALVAEADLKAGARPASLAEGDEDDWIRGRATLINITGVLGFTALGTAGGLATLHLATGRSSERAR